VKRSVGIGIGIGIASIVVIIVFSNIDDLVFSSIQETTGQVEFSNPVALLQTYRIDSRCDLSYFLLDLHYSKKMGIGDTIEVDENKVKVRTEELYNEFKKKLDSQDFRNLPSDMVEFQKVEFQRMKDSINEEFGIGPLMEENSIHPKFKDDVKKLFENLALQYVEANPTRNPTYYEYIRLTEGDFQADPECAQNHKEHFSDTMQMLKSNWGY